MILISNDRALHRLMTCLNLFKMTGSRQKKTALVQTALGVGFPFRMVTLKCHTKVTEFAIETSNTWVTL